jgi:TrpR-related protein YerC/YecD
VKRIENAASFWRPEVDMNKHIRKPRNEKLYEAILKLETMDECMRFFDDLCTVSELMAMEQRYQVAACLNDGMIYNDILAQTGASSATISRVNRCLTYGADGYRRVLDAMGDNEKA